MAKKMTISTRVQKNAWDIRRVDKKLTAIKTKVESIDYSLSNIEVNGRRGLNEALQDIYGKINQIVTKENQRFWNRPMKENLGFHTVLGRMFWIVVGYLAVGAVLHQFGITLPFTEIVTVIFRGKGIP